MNPSVNHDYLHDLAQSIITTGEPKSMTFHLWHMTACPKLFDSQAAVELGIWSREYGFEVRFEKETTNAGDRVMLYFG